MPRRPMNRSRSPRSRNPTVLIWSIPTQEVYTLYIFKKAQSQSHRPPLVNSYGRTGKP